MKERAWGEQKNREKMGRVSEKGEGVGRSPYPLPLLHIFPTRSQLRSLRVFFLEMAATQATAYSAEDVPGHPGKDLRPVG